MILSVFKDNVLVKDFDLKKELGTNAGEQASFFIGRSKTCLVQFDDQKISREQAEIIFDDGKWFLESLSEFADLILNGSKIVDRVQLQNNDMLILTNYSIKIKSNDIGNIEKNNEEGFDELNELTSTIAIETKGTSEKESDFDENNFDPLSDIDITGHCDDGIGGEREVNADEIKNESGDLEELSDLENLDDLDQDISDELEGGDDLGEFAVDDSKDQDLSLDGEIVDDRLPDDEINLNQDEGFEIDNNIDDGFDIDNDDNNEFDTYDSSDDEFNADESTDSGFKIDEDDNLNLTNNYDEDSDDDFQVEPESEDGLDFNQDSLESSTNDMTGSDFSDERTKVIQSFSKFRIMLSGEFAPYDEITLQEKDTIIGRDPQKCQIILNDPEVSGTHAKLMKTSVSCILEDLNSGNGTILNGQRINKSELTNGDEFIIGSTTFTVKILSDFLKEEEARLMPVDDNQVVEIEEIVELDENFDDAELDLAEDGEAFQLGAGEGKSKKSNQSLFDKMKDPANRTKLIRIAIGICVLLLLLVDTEDTEKSTDKKKDDKNKDQIAKDKDKKKGKEVKKKEYKKLSKKELEFVDSSYQLAKELNKNGKYSEAMYELERIFLKIENYKNARQLYEIAKEGVKELEIIAEKERKEREKRERMLKVAKLVEKAKEVTEKRNIKLAESLFNKILELDPENFDVTQLRIDLEAYKKEQERLRVEAANKKALRDRQLNFLKPGKLFYEKENWFGAVQKLEEFLNRKEIDEDLIKQATKMLKESKENLENIVGPLIGKAKSLKEGQDLKGAYEHYRKVLKVDPNNVESLNEINDIRDKLTNRSKKIYREAIISESLSLFEDAKEKFQEVQQVSPSDSEYYNKASKKLKDYLE